MDGGYARTSESRAALHPYGDCVVLSDVSNQLLPGKVQEGLLELEWDRVATHRNVDPLAETLLLGRAHLSTDINQFQYPVGGSVSYGSAGLTFTNAQYEQAIWSHAGQAKIPYFSVEMTIETWQERLLPAYAIVGVGVSLGANKYLAFTVDANHQPNGPEWRFQYQNGEGTFGFGQNPVNRALPARPFTMVFSIIGDAMYGWLKTGSQYELVTSSVNTAMPDLDVRRLENLYQAVPMIKLDSSLASFATLTVSSLRWGYVGQAGLRDPTLVTYEDGTPMIQNNKAYMTFTCATPAQPAGALAGIGSGMYTLDLTTYALQKVGHIMIREPQEEMVYGDLPITVVWDRLSRQFYLFCSSFARPGTLSTRVATSRRNLLSGVHLVDNAAPLQLTGGLLANGQLAGPLNNYDLVARRLPDKRWQVTYTHVVTFDASGTYRICQDILDPDLRLATHNWTDLSAGSETDPTSSQPHEGPKIARCNYNDYIVGAGRRVFPVYEANSGRRVGLLRLEAQHQTGDSPSHVQIISWSTGTSTTYILVTFDVTRYDATRSDSGFTWGTLNIYKAVPDSTANEDIITAFELPVSDYEARAFIPAM